MSEYMSLSEAVHRSIEEKRSINKTGDSRSDLLRHIAATYLSCDVGHMNVADVRKADVLRLLRPIWKDHTPTADVLRGLVASALSWARFEGYRDCDEQSAAYKGVLEHALPAASSIHTTKHREAPTQGELARTMDYLVNGAIYPKKKKPSLSTKAAALIILTACRAHEITEAKWSEVDFEQRILTIPPERRKDKQKVPHRVPLSKQAIRLLKSIEHTNEHIFWTIKNRTLLPASVLNSLKTALREQHPTVTVHGCRSTFSDWAARNGKDITLREMSMMHAVGNAVTRAYQRDDLLEQRRALMQSWADAIFAD